MLKKKKTAHACKTGHLQWFHKHVCTRDDRGGNTRTASLLGKNPPIGSPPLGLVHGPPPCPGLAGLLACSLGDTLTLGRRSALRSRAGPRAPRLQDSPAAFTVLVGSTGTWPTRLPRRFQEPGLIGFQGGDVGWASTSEKAKHCEKNRACAISN